MRRVDGAKVERLIPGDLRVRHRGQAVPEGTARDPEESAEAIVAADGGGEGLNRRAGTGPQRSMTEGDADKGAEVPPRARKEGGGTAEGPRSGRQAVAARGGETGEERPGLMEEVVGRENLLAAYRRVKANGGAPGVDGMTVGALWDHCRAHWARIREELLRGRYAPQPVRRVEIPKPDGKGVRLLGIPTVMDRLIQQALHQVLTPIFDPTFSEGSFGFRPGRGPQDGVKRAREHIEAGYGWVVDMDLEKFFDLVNHDVLMARVARRVKDRRVLLLIRRYLQAGVMEGGLVSPRKEGTPQGGPLSPLLSNILLDDLDKELERRGHRFVRYADDCNVYVKSKAAGERVMASLERFLNKRLRLRVNRDKSAVARPSERKFLGYTVTAYRSIRLKVAPKSLERLRARLRPILRRGRGRNLVDVIGELNPILRGWVAYFRLVDDKVDLRKADEWLRRKLRCIQWRQWKTPRTRLREIHRRGIKEEWARQAAYGGKGPWRSARGRTMNFALPIATLRNWGLVSLLQEHGRLQGAR